MKLGSPSEEEVLECLTYKQYHMRGGAVILDIITSQLTVIEIQNDLFVCF